MWAVSLAYRSGIADDDKIKKMNAYQFAQSFNDLESVTRQMLNIEERVSREQSYISKFGEANDTDSDTAWEDYKLTAQFHLDSWDALKARRDELKTLAAG